VLIKVDWFMFFTFWFFYWSSYFIVYTPCVWGQWLKEKWEKTSILKLNSSLYSIYHYVAKKVQDY
jgi:hypothetical protein